MIIVTGTPGSGKTTVAGRIAASAPRGIHIPADVFWTFPSHPISPYRLEGRDRNGDILAAVTRAATLFAGRGYDVVVDGIIGPWFLPLVARELRDAAVALDYVILMVPLEMALRRVQAREGAGRYHVVRQMHAEFANADGYRDHVIEVGALTPGEVAVEIASRRRAGALSVDVVRAAADPQV